MRKCISSYEKITPFTTLTSDILCEMGDDGGGWLIIQRNDMKTQVNFTNKNGVIMKKDLEILNHISGMA